MASVLDSSDEKTNGFKLMRLIVDGGTVALRQTCTNYHRGNLHVVLSTHHRTLSNLKSKKIINKSQWDKLYPATRKPPNINDFDITLLSVLLRNICGLKPARDPIWDNVPSLLDHSVEADIVRVRLFRNERFGHIPNTAVSDADFKSFWADISAPLVRLGINQSDIDGLENEPCGKEEVERVLKELEKGECKFTNALKETEVVLTGNRDILNENRNVLKRHEDVLNEVSIDVKRIKDKQEILSATLSETLSEIKNVEAVRKDEESRSDELLNKYLVWCNFQTEIELYYEKFTKGTREWVFKEFSAWFDDKNSKTRAFIISGLAGMGKSVIAAAICKKFAEHIAASHFFQYNNSQYDNPKIILQSVAWQVCQVLPAYKKALTKKFSGNLGRSLNDMDINGLFSILFKEPFSVIADHGKTILIVLDAVDESGNNGRDDLALLISSHFHKLPSYIRFLITTRPEKNLIDKFEKLNPLYIHGNDPRNLFDLKMVLQERISGGNAPKTDLVDRLAEKSDGLMLYAFFVSEIYNDDPTTFTIGNLPNGIEEHYEGYFRRLESELGLLEISEDKFFSLLSALAVSMEPLPDAFVETLFGIENCRRKIKRVRKAISSLLTINEDKSISFFHKSLRDWLVDHSDHNYSVDVQDGHKILFDLCVSKLDELKVSGVTDVDKTSAAIKYSVKYWISHLLNRPEDPGKLDRLVSNYVTDLEVIYASVCFNVHLTLDNIRDLTNYKLYQHISENTRAMVARLIFVIRRFSFFLRYYPHTFLQNVVNEGGGDLSLKASLLLQTRYKDIVYLEFLEKDRENDAVEGRCLLSGTISGIDISANHDYVICSYKEGGIELFSTATLMSVWKKPDLELEQCPQLLRLFCETVMLRRCIVFHPGKNLILPERLDEVLTVEGKFRPGPFQCDESCSKFTNCCFSLDNSRMVTNYCNNLIVWNVVCGDKEKSLPCKTLLSLSFTASGNFLGTVDDEEVFNVYDISNDYAIKSLKFDSPFEILSTFKQNWWFCCVDRQEIKFIDHDLNLCVSNLHVRDVILPNSLHHCDELQAFLKHPEQSWFSKVKRFLGLKHQLYSYDNGLRYILIGDKSVLIYSVRSSVMFVFSIKGLVDGRGKVHNNRDVFSKISKNGDFAYLHDRSAKRLTICNLDSNAKYSKSFQNTILSDIPVVREGVILYDINRILKLWSSDVIKCLASFNELAGMKDNMSVSDEVIACLYDSYVVFFNVFTGQIESKTDINEDIIEVYACSIKYHVLVHIKSTQVSLWKNGIKVNGWEKVFRANTCLRCIFSAEFSPQGNKVALFSIGINSIFIFDVVSLRYVARIHIYGPTDDALAFKFFDNENLVCGSLGYLVLY